MLILPHHHHLLKFSSGQEGVYSIVHIHIYIYIYNWLQNPQEADKRDNYIARILHVFNCILPLVRIHRNCDLSDHQQIKKFDTHSEFIFVRRRKITTVFDT